MEDYPPSRITRSRRPRLGTILTACLLLSTIVAPPSAGMAAPLPPEEPSFHVSYDGLATLSRLDTGELLPEVPPVEMGPEYTTWSRLVFQSARNQHDWEIFRARGDGSNQVNLSNNASMDAYPRLNRGATRVVFASNRAGNSFEIFTLNADGSGQTRLTNNLVDDLYPAWSPNGDRIVFQSYRDGQPEVYVMNANGSGQTRLTNSADYDGQPAWSPDGSKIAFVRRQDGQYRVWVMNTDGSDARQLSGQAYSEQPVWSPNGQQIAYDADGDGDSWQEIWVMGANGGNQHQVYEPGEYNTDAWVRSWSPDGRYIAFTRISFVQSGGNWHWTTAYLDAWDSTQPGRTIRLSSNGEDWFPDWQSLDVQPPSSHVQPLPAQSPVQFTVRWSGTDTGNSGLRNFDVQFKEGTAGAWTDWRMNTVETSADFTGIGGHLYAFRSRARDLAGNLEPWPAGQDAVTTVEALPPQTAVEVLPPYSHNGILVRWGGSDPGASGIQNFDVQRRENGGEWVDWLLSTTDTWAQFQGTPGVEYGWRVRARDNAQNLEGWPQNPDATTTLYYWATSGHVTDNRDAPVVGMTLATSPAAFVTLSSNNDGGFAAYVAAHAANYTVNWQKPAYGALPDAVLPHGADTNVDVVMPPANNVVQNWGFESGSSSWQFAGNLTIAITNSVAHSGVSAAFLGSVPAPLRAVAALTSLSPSRVPSFDSAVDVQGTIHTVWIELDGRVVYSRKVPGGTWSASAPLPGPPAHDGASVKILADNSGIIHVVWAAEDALYYSQNQSGAGWSTPENIPGTGNSWIAPGLALGASGVIKVVCSGPANLYNDAYFTERRSDGTWTPLRNIAVTYGTDEEFRVMTDPSGLAHVLWNAADETGYADFWYTAETSHGTWLPPVNLSQYSGHVGDAAMVIDSQGTVHVAWTSDGVYYRLRPANATWSSPEVIAPADSGGVSLFVDEQDQIHLAWGDVLRSQVRYTTRMNGVWSPPDDIVTPTPGPSWAAPTLMVDKHHRVHVDWIQDQDLNNWSIHYAEKPAYGEWSSQVNVFQNDHDTGRPRLLLDNSNTPHAIWYAHVNGRYEILYAGPEPVPNAGEAVITQLLQVPASAPAPTLSFLYDFDVEFPSASCLDVVIDDGVTQTVVFTISSTTNTWTHQWVDLTPWTGHTVALHFRLIEEAGGSHAGAYIDEITVGSAQPDIWVNQTAYHAALAGQRFSHDITYGNRGGVIARNGRVTIELPPDLIFISANPPPSVTEPVVRWDVGDLAGHSPQEAIDVVLEVATGAVGGETVTLTASIASDTIELENVNNTISGTVYIGNLVYLPLANR